MARNRYDSVYYQTSRFLHFIIEYNYTEWTSIYRGFFMRSAFLSLFALGFPFP